jgi:hypothetical protein
MYQEFVLITATVQVLLSIQIIHGSQFKRYLFPSMTDVKDAGQNSVL